MEFYIVVNVCEGKYFYPTLDKKERKTKTLIEIKNKIFEQIFPKKTFQIYLNKLTLRHENDFI